MNESNEEKGPLAKWREQSSESHEKIGVAAKAEKERLAKEEEDRLAAEAAKGVEPPTREDVMNLKGWVAPEDVVEGKPGDEKPILYNVEGPGEPEEVPEELPEEFREYMEDIRRGPKREPESERKKIVIPPGFEVSRIIFNEDGDAVNIVVEKKENLWRVFGGVLVGMVLGVLLYSGVTYLLTVFPLGG